MAKKEVRHEQDERGRVVVFKPSRAQRKSEAQPIPWTPAPKTAWEKIKRKAVG